MARPLVFTTFSPTAYFVGRIVGEHAQVVCPVPEGEDPIYWRPSPEVIEQYQKADLIVINGAEYEKWVANAALPESRMVDTCARFKEQFITFEATTHSHGAEGQHTHEGIDGHTWMDPRNAIEQSAAIVAALKKRRPAQTHVWECGFQELVKDLETLDARFMALAKSAAHATIIASHPAYNYIARRNGIPIRNITMAPDEPLTDAAVASLHALAKGGPPSALLIVLWEEDPLDATRDRLEEEFGIRCVTFDPCENLGKASAGTGRDYLAVMRENLTKLETALADPH